MNCPVCHSESITGLYGEYRPYGICRVQLYAYKCQKCGYRGRSASAFNTPNLLGETVSTADAVEQAKRYFIEQIPDESPERFERHFVRTFSPLAS